MAVTVQMQFESVVTELYQDAFVGSSIENGTTIIQFDLRKLDFQCALGTTAPLASVTVPRMSAVVSWAKATGVNSIRSVSRSADRLPSRKIVRPHWPMRLISSPSRRPTSSSRISSAAKIASVWSAATRYLLEDHLLPIRMLWGDTFHVPLPVGGEVFRVVVGSPSGPFHWHIWP